jgi:mRNA-degrading endonuclease toxin of MazEF toxin-antitoxin module
MRIVKKGPSTPSTPSTQKPKKKIEQNSIWMCSMGHVGIVGHEQKGNRPCYVISDTEYNERSKTPIGFFLSTSVKKQRNKYTYDVDMQGTMENVNISQIRTISSERFLRYMGDGSDTDLKNLMSMFNQVIVGL